METTTPSTIWPETTTTATTPTIRTSRPPVAAPVPRPPAAPVVPGPAGVLGRGRGRRGDGLLDLDLVLLELLLAVLGRRVDLGPGRVRVEDEAHGAVGRAAPGGATLGCGGGSGGGGGGARPVERGG